MIKPAQVLNGIQAHMDMFTTFAAAAGVRDVVEQKKTEKKQLLGGVNNLDLAAKVQPTRDSPTDRMDELLQQLPRAASKRRMSPLWAPTAAMRHPVHVRLRRGLTHHGPLTAHVALQMTSPML